MQVLWPNFKRTIDGVPGLITVAVQDARTLELLTIAYANEEAFRLALSTGFVTHFSTSRNEIWIKGKTSNNLQRIVGVFVNCDGSAVVMLVEPRGNKVACHTNARSCFYRSIFPDGEAEFAPKAGAHEDLKHMDVEVHASLCGGSDGATNDIPSQSLSAAVLFQKIDLIIGLIPNEFHDKERVTSYLRRIQESIRATTAVGMWACWNKTQAVLNSYLPDYAESDWSYRIGTLFSADY